VDHLLLLNVCLFNLHKRATYVDPYPQTGGGVFVFGDMEKEKFEEIIELLIKTYRNYGEDGLFAERDRINEQLAPDLLRLDVPGPIHSNALTVLLYSLGTQPAQEIDRTTRMWIPNQFVTRLKR
jgi:hypothetical protein